MSFNRGLALLLILGVSIPPLAYANSATRQKLQEEANKYAESMPTGSVPATNILGIAESAVPRVTNFKSIVAQVTQGVARDGKIKNALGFEAVPYLLAIDTLDWSTYDQSPLIQILTRTTVSFAAIPSGDGKTASSAFGAQTVLYSDATAKARHEWKNSNECPIVQASIRYQQFMGDLRERFPYAVLAKPGMPKPEFDASLLNEKDRPIYDQLAKDFEKAEKAFETVAQKCQESVNTILQNWNASVVAAGLGWGFYSPGNTINSLKTTSSVYWLTAAYGWGNDGTSNSIGGLLSVHVRKATDERTPDPVNANALLSERSTLYGANLRYGSRNFGLLMEYSSRQSIVPGLSDENVRRGFVGMDAKVAEDLYLSWGVGSETGHRDGVDRKFALTNINYAFGNRPVFINPK